MPAAHSAAEHARRCIMHRWSRGLGKGAKVKGDHFYRDAECQRMYREFVAAVIGRVNTITGVAYK